MQLYYINAGMKGFEKSMGFKDYFKDIKLVIGLIIDTLAAGGDFLVPKASVHRRSVFESRAKALTI